MELPIAWISDVAAPPLAKEHPGRHELCAGAGPGELQGYPLLLHLGILTGGGKQGIEKQPRKNRKGAERNREETEKKLKKSRWGREGAENGNGKEQNSDTETAP